MPDVTAFDVWISRLILDTLGEAMLQACIAAAPRQASLDNLLLDVREGARDEPATVWITETTLGGAGALQSFAERFAAEPQAFFDAVEAALAPSDLELVDAGLRRVLSLAHTDPAVRDGMARLRGTESHAQSAAIWQDLSQVLARQGGVDLSHALTVALNTRLLRPGATDALDVLLRALTVEWDALEDRSGIAIGLREFAYAVTRHPELSRQVRSYLAATLPAGAAHEVSVFAAVFSTLWARESEVRQTSLRSYNPYRSARATDPAVVRELLLRRSVQSVDLSNPGWEEALRMAFSDDGACRLAASTAEARVLRASLVRLSATPIDIGVLQFYPVIDRIERSGDRIFADLLLREHA